MDFELITDAAIEAFIDATTEGLFQTINEAFFATKPLNEVIDLCGPAVVADITKAELQRSDYIDEVNFLAYLKSIDSVDDDDVTIATYQAR